MAWSNRINDPDFQAIVNKNKSNNKKWAIVFIIAPIVILPIIGIAQDDVATYSLIGLCLAVLFAISFVISTLHTKYQRSWEGVVTDKYQKEERRSDRTHDERDKNTYDTYNFVIIREDGGKKHKIQEEDNRKAKVYRYFNIGDRVRFHGGMGLHFPYEKYDKSGDSVLICPFCSHEAPSNEDNCPKCKKPLLK